MIPCFFGSSESPLYGVYTPPSVRMGRTPCGAAVLLCVPWGQDYIRSHWFLRSLAQKLGDKGAPAFRFDNRGTGDSAGVASLDTWLADIHVAEEELRARSGLEKVVLFGFRLGGALAILSGRERTECPLIVVWDPVLDGKGYLEKLRQQDETRRCLVAGAPKRMTTDTFEELRGFSMPIDVVNSIAAIDLTREKTALIPPLVLVSSSLEPEYDAFSSLQRTRMAAVRRENFPENFGWNSQGGLSDLLIPSASIDALVELLEEEIF